MGAQPAFDRGSLIERAFAHTSQPVVPLRDRSIGAVLVDAGRLSAEDAERVLRLQSERGLRFGDAAIELGVLTAGDVQFGLDSQYEHSVLAVGDPALSPEVIAAFQPAHRTTEAIRQLRTQLQLRWIDSASSRRTIAVISTDAGVGRSYITANLAVLFAQLGERTLLIDADLRAPRQHELFRLDNSVGLSNILTDRAGFDRVCSVKSFSRLAVLPAGPASPNPQELLARSQFARLMEAARERFDVVLIDTPSWFAGADAQIISARAGAAVLVACPGKTSLRALDAIVGSLTECGTPLIGSVANRI